MSATDADDPLPDWARPVAGPHDRALLLALADLGEVLRRLHRVALLPAATLPARRVLAACGPLLDRLVARARARDLIDLTRFDLAHATDYARRQEAGEFPEEPDDQP